jgi:hypothetical protein
MWQIPRWLNCTILTMAAMLVAVGCSDDPSMTSPGRGHLRITVDALGGAQAATEAAVSPVQGMHDEDGHDRPSLSEINVTFSAVLARNLGGELVPVEMALPVTVDVLALVAGPSITLPSGLLSPGIYDGLVVNMTAVQLVTQDDVRITIEPPGGGWTSVVPVEPFEVVEGTATDLVLHFRLDRAIRFLGGGFEFRPEFECEKG